MQTTWQPHLKTVCSRSSSRRPQKPSPARSQSRAGDQRCETAGPFCRRNQRNPMVEVMAKPITQNQSLADAVKPQAQADLAAPEPMHGGAVFVPQVDILETEDELT